MFLSRGDAFSCFWPAILLFRALEGPPFVYGTVCGPLSSITATARLKLIPSTHRRTIRTQRSRPQKRLPTGRRTKNPPSALHIVANGKRQMGTQPKAPTCRLSLFKKKTPSARFAGRGKFYCAFSVSLKRQKAQIKSNICKLQKA